MFGRSKPKIGCSSSINNRRICSSLFNVRKHDVQMSLMSDLVNLVKSLLGSMFDVHLFQAKNRVFEFHYQFLWCSSQFDEWFSKFSESPIRFDVRSFVAKIFVWCSSSIPNRWISLSSFNVCKMMFEFVQCLIKCCSTHH